MKLTAGDLFIPVHVRECRKWRYNTKIKRNN